MVSTVFYSSENGWVAVLDFEPVLICGSVFRSGFFQLSVPHPTTSPPTLTSPHLPSLPLPSLPSLLTHNTA